MHATLQKILLVLIAAFAFSVHAEEIKTIETCKLEGTLFLNQWTQIYCDSDLQVADGARIVTNGFELNIATAGSLKMDGAFEIKAFDSIKGLNQEAARVTLLILGTATGNLKIENCGRSTKDMGHDVSVEVITAAGLELELTLDQAHAGYAFSVDNQLQTVPAADCAAL